jgi:SAM-dependent methyltransferase
LGFSRTCAVVIIEIISRQAKFFPADSSGALNSLVFCGNLRNLLHMSNTPSKNLQTAAAPDPWEAAYLRFETPEQEVRKFISRLRRLGASGWPRNAEVVELFCGRGSGLQALAKLGFTQIEGVDVSPRLLAEFAGNAKVTVADCRSLPFPSHNRDILIVQGGLHHLPALPEDLARTLSEIHRVLRPNGRVMIVEPWQTPFLGFVHFASEIRLLRSVSNKLDAFATMTEHERDTYERWLGQPQLILKLAHEKFSTLRESFAWGKWNFVGTPR